MKKILVTGASGFIGRHCIPFLQKKGYEIFALYRTKFLKDFSHIHWVQADVLNPVHIADIMAKIAPSHMLHLAWDVTPGKFVTALDNLNWVKAGLTLLESFCTNQGKRVVMAGTCFEYDLTNSPLNEQNTPLKPATLYGASKLSLNHVVESYARQMNVSAAWARIFYLYGPHEYPQRFVPSIINGLLKKQIVPCTHCQQVRDFLYVEDVAEGLVELLDSNIEGSLNISSGEGIRLRTMIEQIEDHLHIKDLVHFDAIQANSLEPSHIIGDVERLNRELKWRPRWSLQEGLAKTIHWWNGVS